MANKLTLRIVTKKGGTLEIEGEMNNDVMGFCDRKIPFRLSMKDSKKSMLVRPYYRKTTAGNLTVFCEEA